MYNGANFEDLSEVVRHVKSLNPGIPVAATGVSMGGYIVIYFKFYYSHLR
jgi:alpha-beta hydrolase superfamily lysophospholipase